MRKAPAIIASEWYIRVDGFVTGDPRAAVQTGSRWPGAKILQEAWPPVYFVSEREARRDPNGEDAYLARRQAELRERSTA